MTPTVAEQMVGLARLNKQEKIDVPISTARREMLMLKMIQEALNSGVTWANIGRVVIGRADGKAAKRYAKQLARSTQREILRNMDAFSESASAP
jgi:hypothetical protein